MKPFLYILFLFFLLSFTKDSIWKMLDTNSTCTARHECGFVAHEGKLYLMGGRGIKPVDVFDPKTNTWTALAPTPFEIHHFTPVSFDGKIYIVGGFTGQYPEETPLTHVYTYDPKSNSWIKVLEIPKERQRGGAGVTIYNNKIYIVNGITFGHTSGTCALFDVYDPKANTWTVLPDAPSIRDHSAATIVDNTLIAMGGRNTSYHEPEDFQAFFKKVNNSVDYFDFKTNKWGTYKTEHPAPAAGGGCVVLNGKIFYIGGETGLEKANNQVFAFDIKNASWTQKTFLNRGRHGTNAVILKNKIYIAAGSGNRGGGPELNTIEVFD
jgi:N-acetylneuraminic acid mutarotase